MTSPIREGYKPPKNKIQPIRKWVIKFTIKKHFRQQLKKNYRFHIVKMPIFSESDPKLSYIVHRNLKKMKRNLTCMKPDNIIIISNPSRKYGETKHPSHLLSQLTNLRSITMSPTHQPHENSKTNPFLVTLRQEDGTNCLSLRKDSRTKNFCRELT